MSLLYSVYICPRCGYFIEKSSDGNLIYKENKYLKLQCLRCKCVEFINNIHGHKQNRKLSECCHVEMESWDGGCPSCGHKMIEKILSDN